MTIYELRELLERCEMEDLPLRCATYSRVSTEKETQAASLVNMTDDFREYIDRRPNWVFVKAYIDDGKSGLTTKKREEFLSLLAAGAAGEYDLLITGEISRFGRNTLEGLANIKYLRDRGIPVIFLYDDLNTYDPDCDIQIQQKLVDAENESHKISRRVRRGHAKSIRKGHVLGNRMWGYKKANCRLVIDEETAPVVREIFELYATNEYSMKQIEQILYDRGFRNSNGNRLSHTTMANIIQNPKYKGCYAGGKVRVIDLYTKKQKFLPEEDWVTFQDETGGTVPALVSEALWERANEVFRRRSLDVKGRRNCSTHRNTYTGKLFCGVDGAPYYCKDVHYKGTSVSKWVCSHRIKHGAASCPSVAVYEDELSGLVLDVFRDFADDAGSILDRYIAQYAELMNDTAEADAQRRRLAEELERIEKKKDAVLELKLEGALTLDEFKRRMDALRADADKCKTELQSLSRSDEAKAALDVQIERLRAALPQDVQRLTDGVITRDFVDSYIGRITITPDESGVLDVEMRLLTDGVVHRELKKLKGRTGHMSKKMIEAYERGMK